MYTFEITPNKSTRAQAHSLEKTRINVENDSIAQKTKDKDFHHIFTVELDKRAHKA